MNKQTVQTNWQMIKMTEKRFNIEFDGHQYFLVIDEDNERCLARLDTRMDALAWLEMYKMLSEENEQLKSELQDKRLGINLFNAENTLLMEENENIKQTIKDMMENERTELGKSVLKQLWEAIQ